ncbi:protein PAF1 homolog isoform X2 [Capsicum annuum]|uniref:protein PAF1 homolog isoform X2 n=1 Tax=Capsicum annuum TaxID=4072 RepID=UPI001FB105E1|nr:protein PAF1 homolog isoform X2 [Capsicum annuum]
MKGHGSTSTPHTSHRRIAPLTENPLKKPTHFHGKLTFRNELPDPSAQLRTLSLRKEPDREHKAQKSYASDNKDPRRAKSNSIAPDEEQLVHTE